jgi:hypothetical protein
MMTKEILIHGVMHTGGTFCRILLGTSAPRIEPKRKVQIEYNQEGSKYKPINDSLQGLKVVETSFNNKIKFFASHHIIPNQPIYNMIMDGKCPIPVVTTLRDPILIANTFLYRYIIKRTYPNYMIKWRREKEIERQVKVIHECIDMHNDSKTFLLPVDLNNKLLAGEIFDWCGIKKTTQSIRFIREWKSANTTQKVISDKFKKQEKESHQLIKEAVVKKDIDFVRNNLSIEFDYLNKQDDLKKKLQKIGYENLIWF